jgi:PufQ cytochrome subunit
MSVQMTNSGSQQGHPQRAPRAEFYAYFALIFLGALSYACVAWVASLIVARKLPAKNPISRAWADAGAITPSIFRA